MKLLNLISRCVPEALRRWLSLAQRPVAQRNSSLIRLEALEDRLPLSTTSFLASPPTQPTMIASNVDPAGGAFDEETIALSHFSAPTVPLALPSGSLGESALNQTQQSPSPSGQPYPLLWMSRDNADTQHPGHDSLPQALPPSTRSEGVSGNPVLLPGAAAMAQGIGLPEARYLLVAALVSDNSLAQPAASNPVTVPGEESFALFLPRTRDSASMTKGGIDSLTGAQEDPFEAIARGSKKQPSPWEMGPVRKEDGQDAPSGTEATDRTEVGRLENTQPSDLPGSPQATGGEATAPAVTDQNADAKVGDEVAPPVLGPTDQDTEVFADPSFLPPTMELRLVVLAVALSQNLESDRRKARESTL